MNKTTAGHKRVNIILPVETLKTLNRVAEAGERSSFINEAVNYYLKAKGRRKLRKELKRGAEANAARDLKLAEEWFLLDSVK